MFLLLLEFFPHVILITWGLESGLAKFFFAESVPLWYLGSHGKKLSKEVIQLPSNPLNGKYLGLLKTTFCKNKVCTFNNVAKHGLRHPRKCSHGTKFSDS